MRFGERFRTPPRRRRRAGPIAFAVLLAIGALVLAAKWTSAVDAPTAPAPTATAPATPAR